MARGHATLRIAGLLLLASCAAPAWRDRSEPLLPSDLAALPDQVTPENARLIVRRCLQQWAAEASTPERRSGFAFTATGFAALSTTRSPGESRERHARRIVEYRSIRDVASEVVSDTARFRRLVEVTLTGTFRTWEKAVTPYTESPEIGAEPSTREEARFVLVRDEPGRASKLVEALKLLSRP